MAGSKKKRKARQAAQSASAHRQHNAAQPPGIAVKIQSACSALARPARRYRIALEILALACIFTLGVFCRLDDLSHWRKNESLTFHDSKPIHTTFDAWFYLSLAQDLIDGTYAQPDEKRGVPQSPPRPSPPPLISVLAALIVKTTSFSLCWVGAILPAVLGPLIVLPLYMFGRFYGGAACGLMASLAAVLYPFYINRSNVGRFDTDCLILSFALGAAYLFMRFGLTHSLRRYAHFCSGMLLFFLFLWWWDQSPAAVWALTGLPLAAALVFFYRPSFREGLIFYSILAACALTLVLCIDPGMPIKIAARLWHEFLYISKEQSGLFPNVGTTISEQTRPSIEDIVRFTTAGTLSFLFAAAGFALLLWHRRAHAIFLLPFIILSILAATTANRFVLFIVPLAALGTGYALAAIWRVLQRAQPLNLIVCTAIAATLCIPLYTLNARSAQRPKEPGFMVQAMKRIREITPDNAVIWAWWDHGYALTYYARRATINDGSIHGGELTMINAIPYTTDSSRLAANFMHFYVSRGMQGVRSIYRQFDDDADRALQFIKEVLSAGPDASRSIIKQADLKPADDRRTIDDWVRFFFPNKQRPLYLMCDHLLSRTAYWWYWFGSWDIAAGSGRHPVFRSYTNISYDQQAVRGSNGLVINRKTGTFLEKNRQVALAGIKIYSRAGSRTLNTYGRAGLRLEFNHRYRNGAIMDPQIAESVFSRLFIRLQPDTKYFRPVINAPPRVQLWEVKGDRAP